MGLLGDCPGRAGGFREGAGQEGNTHGASFGLSFEYRGVGHHLTLLGTICNLMANEKERMQVCKCCGD